MDIDSTVAKPNEIEVTAEMIEAGEKVIADSLRFETESYGELGDLVFREMLSLYRGQTEHQSLMKASDVEAKVPKDRRVSHPNFKELLIEVCDMRQASNIGY